MRRRFGICLLAVLMLAALTVTAFAADPGIQIKEEKDKANCVLTPVGTEQKLKLEISNADAENVVIVTKSEIKSASDWNADNIMYINQVSATGGKAVFDGQNAIQPSEMVAGQSYYLYRSGTDTARMLVAVFSYESGAADVLLGDADGNGTIDSSDAVAILQYAVAAEADKAGIIPTARIANADVDKNGVVDSSDAVYILQYSVAPSAEQTPAFFENLP